MSDFAIFDELPSSKKESRSAVWATAQDNPGKWVQTNLSRNIAAHRANHPDYEFAVRDGVLYVRWPAPATNGGERR